MLDLSKENKSVFYYNVEDTHFLLLSSIAGLTILFLKYLRKLDVGGLIIVNPHDDVEYYKKVLIKHT